MKLLGHYKNGNYTVSIFSDGTKIRQNNLDYFEPDTVESMDIKITNKCDRGCKFCFTDDTMILMSDGTYKQIKDVHVGDTVRSYNLKTQQFENQKVLDRFKSEAESLMELTCENGEVIRCTPNHKFLTARGWIAACDLTDFDEIVENNIK